MSLLHVSHAKLISMDGKTWAAVFSSPPSISVHLLLLAFLYTSFITEAARDSELPLRQRCSALLCSARNKVMQHLTPLMVRSNCHNTHLHSPDNSLRLRTGTRCETVAAAAAAGRRSEGKGMDRSTGRVVVPFSGCAAPSLHPCWWCRVGERSLAIEGRGEREKTRRKERKGERERERERRRRRGKEGPQLAKSLSIRSAACCLRSLEDTLVYAANKKVQVIKSSFKV